MWAYLHRTTHTGAPRSICKPLLMQIKFYQHCIVSACLHMHMQNPHGSPKPPIAPSIGLEPAALGYTLMYVYAQVCEVQNCVKEPYLSLKHLWSILKYPIPLCTEKGDRNKFREFIPVQSLQSVLWSSHLWLSDTSSCEELEKRCHSVTTLTFICEEGFKYSLISETRSSWAFGYNSEVITTYYLTKMHNYERIHSSILKPEY